MAMSDHLLRFRQMTEEELVAERDRLNVMNSGFSAQAMGTKSYQVAVDRILEQLNAIAFVRKERGMADIPPPAPVNNNIGITDFSGIQ